MILFLSVYNLVAISLLKRIKLSSREKKRSSIFDKASERERTNSSNCCSTTRPAELFFRRLYESRSCNAISLSSSESCSFANMSSRKSIFLSISPFSIGKLVPDSTCLIGSTGFFIFGAQAKKKIKGTKKIVMVFLIIAIPPEQVQNASSTSIPPRCFPYLKAPGDLVKISAPVQKRSGEAPSKEIPALF